MNRVSLRIGLLTTMAALSALAFSTAGAGTASAQSFGKDGAIHACYKAKGKNKGALRVVPTASGCRKLRGWRPVSWTANSTSGGSGQNGSEGAAGQIEKSLTETIQKQTNQIDDLTEQVTDLTGEVLTLEGDLVDLSGGLANVEGDVTDLTGGLVNLEGTVGETCDQLTTVTEQSDEILESLLGASVGGILNAVLNIPSLPDELGTFECTS